MITMRLLGQAQAVDSIPHGKSSARNNQCIGPTRGTRSLTRPADLAKPIPCRTMISAPTSRLIHPTEATTIPNPAARQFPSTVPSGNSSCSHTETGVESAWTLCSALVADTIKLLTRDESAAEPRGRLDDIRRDGCLVYPHRPANDQSTSVSHPDVLRKAHQAVSEQKQETSCITAEHMSVHKIYR